MRRSQGLSLIEVMFVLVIVAMLTVTVARYYQTLQRTSLSNAVIEMMNTTVQATYAWLGMGNTLEKLSLEQLIDNGLVPADFKFQSDNNASGHPWGGAIEVQKDSENPNRFVIVLDELPPKACQNLQLRLNDYGVEEPVCEPQSDSGNERFIAAFSTL